MAFNKHSKIKPLKYSITIKNLCCEYCLSSMIEELLLIDGIEVAFSTFDYENKKNIVIEIEYDSKFFYQDEILELEKKFNSY